MKKNEKGISHYPNKLPGRTHDLSQKLLWQVTCNLNLAQFNSHLWKQPSAIIISYFFREGSRLLQTSGLKFFVTKVKDFQLHLRCCRHPEPTFDEKFGKSNFNLNNSNKKDNQNRFILFLT